MSATKACDPEPVPPKGLAGLPDCCDVYRRQGGLGTAGGALELTVYSAQNQLMRCWAPALWLGAELFPSLNPILNKIRDHLPHPLITRSTSCRLLIGL
jgi:hypothetical protein